MAIKKVLLSKKINNTIYDIFPKTSADVVVYGESTVATTLAQFATDLANVYTKEAADEAIAAESKALYNKIMGITEEDGATVTEAYDTLKEVAKWIEEHGDVAAAFTTDIAALKTAVGDENSGLVKAVADLQAALSEDEDDIADLQTAVAKLETAVGNANSGLVKAMADAEARIDNLEEVVNGEDGLAAKVADLIAVAGSHVEASTTNGNILVNNEEVVVYTHPETHSAEMIVETTDKQFVTAAEKSVIANAAAVLLVSSQDEVTTENDLYLVEIA